MTKKKTHEPDLPETHWPILLSYVAALLFAEVKGVLDPLVGYVLVLESAIIASKYHPDLIEPGQWRLEDRGGQLAIHR